MGGALVDVAPQVTTPQGRDCAMGTRKNDRDQYWKPKIMFLMGKQMFVIASKPRSFFLGLCLNLIILATKILAKFSPNAKNQIKKQYFITFFFGENKSEFENKNKIKGIFWPHFYLDFRGRGEGGIFVLTSKVFG